jgi:hypothetical protein
MDEKTREYLVRCRDTLDMFLEVRGNEKKSPDKLAEYENIGEILHTYPTPSTNWWSVGEGVN